MRINCRLTPISSSKDTSTTSFQGMEVVSEAPYKVVQVDYLLWYTVFLLSLPLSGIQDRPSVNQPPPQRTLRLSDGFDSARFFHVAFPHFRYRSVPFAKLLIPDLCYSGTFVTMESIDSVTSAGVDIQKQDICPWLPIHGSWL